METNHTPGPWRYIPDFSAVTIIRNHELKAVADFGKVDLPETEANARLIAAAPELLAALEDAEFILRKAAQVAGPMRDSFARSADDARNAIKKAKGE